MFCNNNGGRSALASRRQNNFARDEEEELDSKQYKRGSIMSKKKFKKLALQQAQQLEFESNAANSQIV